MKKILIFTQRLSVAYSLAWITIVFSIFNGLRYSGIVESDIFVILFAFSLALIMLFIYNDGCSELKNINYYSKVASLNYLFIFFIVIYNVLLKGFDIHFILAPSILLSFFNIYLCFKMKSNSYALFGVYELKKLHKLLPNVRNIKIDYDYTFLKKDYEPQCRQRLYKIITSLGNLFFDGEFFYLNGSTYDIANFISGYNLCKIDIDKSTQEDAEVIKMYCI